MKKSLVLLFVFAFTIIAFSQKSNFSDIKPRYVQNFGTIYGTNSVEGYYMFYKIDKADRKNNNYKLIILDENLERIASKRIVRTKYSYLIDMSYNGSAFCLVFINKKHKTIDLLTFDKEMNKLGEFSSQKLKSYELYVYYNKLKLISAGNTTQKVIQPIKDNGFVVYGVVKNKKIGYTLEYFPNDLSKNDSWKISSSENSRESEDMSWLASNEKYVISQIAYNRTANAKKAKFKINIVDTDKGEVLFDGKIKDDENFIMVGGVYFDEDNNDLMITGEYFPLRDDGKEVKDKGLGVAIAKVNYDGSITSINYYSREKDMKKFLKHGKKEDRKYYYFHQSYRTNDNKLYMIAEEYRTSASVSGIISKIAGSGSESLIKVVLNNMLVFEFDSDGELLGIESFEKESHDVLLPAGAALYPTPLLGRFIKNANNFDFKFSQQSEDKEMFYFTYRTRKRVKNRTVSFLEAVIRSDDDDYGEDEIMLRNKEQKSIISVFPAKTGYVLVSEYFRKKREMNVRLEKINY